MAEKFFINAISKNQPLKKKMISQFRKLYPFMKIKDKNIKKNFVEKFYPGYGRIPHCKLKKNSDINFNHK